MLFLQISPHETIDIELVDDENRSFPARVFFNDSARSSAESLEEHVVVLGKAPEERPEIMVPETSNSDEPSGLLNMPDNEPWIYIKIAEAADGTQAAGWSAPFEAVTSRDTFTSQATLGVDATALQTAVNSESSAESPFLVEAASHGANFSYSITGGSSQTNTLICQKGAQGQQYTLWWPFAGGVGTFELLENNSAIGSPVVFTGWGDFSGVSTGLRSQLNRNYKVEINWSSGGPVAANGSISCL